MELYDTLNAQSDGSSISSLGMLLLWETNRIASCLQFARTDGMLPSNWLSDKKRFISPVMLPSAGGIFPVN